MPTRTPRDTSFAYQRRQKRFDRIVQAAVAAGAVLITGWFLVIAHFVWKFW